MPEEDPPMNLQERLSEAVRHYWHTRLSQAKKQGSVSGVKDYAGRADVTGGKHMDGFASLICDLVKESGISSDCVFSDKKKELPGFFRPTKDWDLIVVANSNLLAAMELKSHAGPSYGNNCNNRVEEALGNATDLWTAFREQTFAPSIRPWAGYLMFLEDSKGSSSPIKAREPQFKIRPEFRDTAYETKKMSVSYAKRYELFCRKLVLERLYDSACFITSDREGGLEGKYTEPAQDLRFADFVASLVGKATEYVKAKQLHGGA
jgi:hypothetical protein